MDPGDLGTMYMAGASGTYVDARKAQAVGMAPASAKKLVQIGNTSLELAKDLALDPEMLDRLNSMTKELLAHHIIFASSPSSVISTSRSWPTGRRACPGRPMSATSRSWA